MGKVCCGTLFCPTRPALSSLGERLGKPVEGIPVLTLIIVAAIGMILALLLGAGVGIALVIGVAVFFIAPVLISLIGR